MDQRDADRLVETFRQLPEALRLRTAIMLMGDEPEVFASAMVGLMHGHGRDGQARGGMRALLLALTALAVAPSLGTAADDGRARPLVAGVGSNAMPSWFPDGSRLLFHSRRKDQPQHGLATRNLWTVAADGTGARRLTKGTKDEYHGVVSPDGRRIVFVSELNGSRDLWIADVSGENAVPLTDDPGIEDQPTWSPDARRVAYAAFPKDGGSFDLWVINADGTGRQRLTTTAANEIFPAWHPDGDRIAFVTDANGNFDLYVLSLRDGTTSPLVVSPDHEARPAWSPDGTRLAFSRWPAQGRSTDATLWIANADGTAPVELEAAPAPATHPAFAPDGRALAFQHRGPTGWEIWRLDLPADLAQGERLRLAQQVRGGADVDTAKLRNGDTVRGLLRESHFVLRAPYGVLDLRAATVASILFDDRGLARVVLGNGDTASGVLDATELHLAGGGRIEAVPVARLAQLSLRAAHVSGAGAFRAVMRNGDRLSVAPPGALRLRVGGQTLEVEPRRIDQVEFADGGARARVALVGGDSLAGDVVGGRLDVVLAAGPRLALDPSALRSLARVGTAP
jgi:Tol biopolymer transport system component